MATQLNLARRKHRLAVLLLLSQLLAMASTAVAAPLKFTESEQRYIANNPRVRVGVDPSWSPFEFIAEDGTYQGIAADYLAHIHQKTGLRFEVQQNKTWDEVIKHAKEGSIDLLPAVMSSPERRQYLRFTTPHINYPMVIVTRNDSANIDHFEALNGKRVVVVKGYVTEDILRRNHPDIHLVTAKNITEMVNTVATGKAFALVDNIASVSNTIAKLGISTLKINNPENYQFKLSIAVQKDNALLFSIIQKSLNSLTAGDHRKIKDQWIHGSYHSQFDMTRLLRLGFIVTLFFGAMVFWNRRLHQEIERRKNLEIALHESEKNYRTLVESGSGVTWRLNLKNGNFTYMSPQIESLLGYPSASWTDVHVWAQRIHPDDRQQAVDTCEEQTLLLNNHSFDYRVITETGSIVWIRDIVTVIAQHDSAQELLGCMYDITDRKGQEESLVKALGQAKQATRVKSQFLATMSHEIRTPMNGVLGMAHLLAESHLNNSQQQMLSVITRSGESLLEIINDILDYSKLESQTIQFENIAFNLKVICHDVIALFASELRDKNIFLTLSYADDLPECYTGDPMRIRQVVLNLVSNAMKFTTHGSVTIKVRKSKHTRNNDSSELRISVCDTGIGIDSNVREQLFKPFSQADQTTTRKYGGTGLGLSICKKIIEAMGSHIELESTLGQGTTFWFDLDLPVAKQGAETINLPTHTKMNPGKSISETTHHQAIQQETFPSTILLGEDNAINRQVAVTTLERLGATVATAADGNEVIEMWQSGVYDLIFMDCRMPNVDGYQATQIIRANGGKLPIVAFTANATVESKKQCLDAGMDDVLIKPFKRSDLIACLKKWLPQSETAKRGEYAAFNTHELEKNFGSDFDILEDFMANFILALPSMIDELKKTYFHNDYPTFSRQAHTLKGQLGLLCAEKLAEQAFFLESHSSEHPSNQQDLNRFITDLLTLSEQLQAYQDTDEVHAQQAS